MLVKSKKNYPMIAFAVVYLIAAIINIDLFDNTSPLMFVLVGVFTLYFIYQLIWIAFGETIFEINNENLIVKSGLPFIKNNKIYDITQISNVRTIMMESSTYWGFTGFRLADYKSPVICFNYNKKEVFLGKNLAEFNLDELKKWIS